MGVFRRRIADEYAKYFLKKNLRPPMRRGAPLLLIAMMGLIGSGKTTVARLLAQRIGLAHVRTDDIRVFLMRRGIPRKRAVGRAVPVAERLTRMLLFQGISVILDADFTAPQPRKKLRALCKNAHARPYFVAVKTTERVILARLRKHRYTRNDIFSGAEDALRWYFTRKKLRALHRSRFRPLATVQNTKPLAPQVTAVAKKLRV